MQVLRLVVRGVLGGLLALGLAACAGPTELDASDRPTPVPPSSAPTSGSTTAGNVAATKQVSAWLLHAVPMPPGSREWSHSPTTHFRRGSIGIGPADPAFSRHTWWTVPLTGPAFDSWVRAHAPTGLHAEAGSSGSVESSGEWERDLDLRSAGTAASTPGWVNFAYTSRADGLVVRVDTFVGARFARTAFVPDATAVTIRRVDRSFGRPRHVTTRRILDARAVTDLLRMVNALPGAMTEPFVASCPAATTQRSYRITFETTGGQYVADLPTTACWPDLTLSHEGTAIPPRLDPGRQFTRVADRYLR